MTTSANAIRGGLLIFATAMLAGCGPTTASPGASPGASPTADVAPSASAPLSGPAAPGEVTIDPSLPEALPLPDDIWEQTGPGWVLATYFPQYERRAGEGQVWQAWEPESVKKVLYLVSPEGQRYQVLELDPERGFSVESWTAGETQAIVREIADSNAWVYGILDLTTGDISPYQTPSEWAEVRINLPDSVRVWVDQGELTTFIEREGEFLTLAEGWLPPGRDPMAPSPDGNWIAMYGFGVEGGGGQPVPIGVASLSTGEITAFPDLDALGFCNPRGWTDSGNLLVGCRPEVDDAPLYFEANPSTGTITESDYVQPAVDPIGLHHDFWMSPGVWAGNGGIGTGEGEQENGVGVEDHGVVREIVVRDENGGELQLTTLEAVVNEVLYIEAWKGWTPVVVVYDLATDRQVVLLPGPPNAADLGPDTSSSAAVSWVVAP